MYDSRNSATTTIVVFTDDANGNTLSDPSGKSYTWDFENRLIQRGWLWSFNTLFPRSE